MALFTDGPISSIDDLSGQDSQLLDVASNEGIDLTRKLSLAQEVMGMDITAMLDRLQFPGQSTFTPGLDNVVVTPPLKLWHTYRTLAMTYADAYNNQLNDRYGAKRDQFRQLESWISETLTQSGIGIAVCPVAIAVAPAVIPIPGSLADGTYYVTVSWANSAGEAGASSPFTVVTLSASTMQVMTGTAPNNACGWNIYVGDSPESMVQQNQSPIPVGQDWFQPAVLFRSGHPPGSGQNATYFRATPRLILRG
jgi:hypothetical protein